MPRIKAATVEAHGQRQREQILDAAYRMFEADGYRAATPARIAAAAGLARPSLYKYFADRPQLLFEAVMRQIELGLAAARHSIDEIAEPEMRIAAWLTALTRYIAGPERRLLAMIDRLPVAHAVVRERLARAHTRMRDELHKDFAAALDGSGLDAGLWVALFDATARAAGRHAVRRDNLEAVLKEVLMVNRAFFLTRYTPGGISVRHP